MPDAGTVVGDYVVWSRDVQPDPHDYSLPRNMPFTVTYVFGVNKAGAQLDWYGDIRLLSESGEMIPATVTPILEGTVFRVVPVDPLPADQVISFADILVKVPCGWTEPCEIGPPKVYATRSIGHFIDVEKPILADQTFVLRDWKAYARVEPCMGTLCAGLEISHLFDPATGPDTPAAGIHYRRHYRGSTFELPSPLVATAMECTHCFHALDSPPITDLGPYEIRAVDLLGHESDGRILVTIEPASCDRLIVDMADGGVVSLVDAGPDADAPPPDAPLPDAPIQTQTTSSGGCSTTGTPRQAWLALGVVSLLLVRARGRSRRTR